MVTYHRSRRLSDAILVKGMLDGLDNYYPAFSDWYVNTCMPGILVGRDELIVARDRERVVGAALGKVGSETKLRCVRVIPEYQKRGIGLHLVEQMLRAIDYDKPLCTVSEEMVHEFSRPFINLFRFDLTAVDKGRYRHGKLEYVFNGAALPS